MDSTMSIIQAVKVFIVSSVLLISSVYGDLITYNTSMSNFCPTRISVVFTSISPPVTTALNLNTVYGSPSHGPLRLNLPPGDIHTVIYKARPYTAINSNQNYNNRCYFIGCTLTLVRAVCNDATNGNKTTVDFTRRPRCGCPLDDDWEEQQKEK